MLENLRPGAGQNYSSLAINSLRQIAGISFRKAGKVLSKLGTLRREQGVIASAVKLMRRGRHRVLGLEEIDGIVTDAMTDPMIMFAGAWISVIHV